MPEYIKLAILISGIGGIIVALSNRHNFVDCILSLIMVPFAIFMYAIVFSIAWGYLN